MPAELMRLPARAAGVGRPPVFGARPLKRVIQREVETPVGRRIVSGKLMDGGTVRVDAIADGLRIDAGVTPRVEAPA